MKTAIIVDSACDLPRSFMEANDIFIMPVKIQFLDSTLQDDRNDVLAVSFFDNYKKNKKAKLVSSPVSADKICRIIVNKIAQSYDNLLIICISSTRSEIYRNAKAAALLAEQILFGTHSKSAQKTRLKNISVIDSHTLFSGQALLTYEASMLQKSNDYENQKQLSDQIRYLANFVYTYVILDDLFYVNYRGKQRGEKSIGVFSYTLGKLLNVNPILLMRKGESQRVEKSIGFDASLQKLLSIAEDAVFNGHILIQAVVVSYAGDISKIENHPQYQKFRDALKSRGIEIILTVMSITAGVYVGPGALALSYCGDPFGHPKDLLV